MDEHLIDVQNVCRICLRIKNLMISLNCAINEEETSSPCIKELIQDMFSAKVKLFGEYPGNICYICLEVLKTVNQLKQQFLDTEIILKTLLEGASTFSEQEATVEVIVGNNTFNLNDILIVEEEKTESKNYSGFLTNLGKSISASFVRKDLQPEAKKNFEENPIVIIEKKVKLEENLENVMLIERNIEHKYTVENIKLNVNELDITNLPDAEQEIFKSALNIQFKCNICQKLYSKKWRLLKHLERCEKTTVSYKNESVLNSPLTCPYCKKSKKIFKDRILLNNHIKIIHNTKYTCDICKATFHNKNRFAYHKNTKHLNDLYVCQYCGKKFLTKSSLNMHMLRHTHRHIAQCICPICGKTFHYSGGLFYHMKIHTNERKYCCQYCDRKFYTATAQQRHIRTHTGERPYACKFCVKSFFSSSEQRKHQYLHTGNMPYHCQYCKKGFTCKYNMNRHVIKHSGMYKCEICGKGLISIEVLRKHCDIIHRENNP